MSTSPPSLDLLHTNIPGMEETGVGADMCPRM